MYLTELTVTEMQAHQANDMMDAIQGSADLASCLPLIEQIKVVFSGSEPAAVAARSLIDVLRTEAFDE